MSPVSLVVTPALRRIVLERDRGCVWDGCSNDKWLRAHHVLHFADGGPTRVDNLVMLCGFHHRLIHDDDWTMVANADGSLSFIRPDGHQLESQPPPLRPEIRERFFGGVAGSSL